MTRQWSPQQSAIFDACTDPNGGNLIVEAFAGTGKTTTIVEAASRIPTDRSVLVVAFNKQIQTELSRRLPEHVACATLHSFGFRLVRRAFNNPKVDAHSVSKWLRIKYPKLSADGRDAICKLVSLAKATLSALESNPLDSLAYAFDIELPRSAKARTESLRIAVDALASSRACSNNTIDFDDMIWLPVECDLPLPKYNTLFVDEAQDLNACQTALVLGLSDRIVAVGDSNQAIYGFRGASSGSLEYLRNELKASTLPLSTTYRCAHAIVSEANRYVPLLKAAKDALTGTVQTCTKSYLLDHIEPEDFVLSRTNAPLVSLCLQWLAQGVRATVCGKDIGIELTKLVRKSKAGTAQEFLAWLREWEAAEVEYLKSKERDPGPAQDKAQCLRAVAENCGTLAEITGKLERIFSDGNSGGIILSSVHKAKGLEAERVWVLTNTFFRRPGQEEANLYYVAVTRAKTELNLVRGDCQ